MKCRFGDLEIRGIATSLPSHVSNLHDLAAERGADEVQRIVTNTGVEAIRVAPPTLTTADLCETAARHLLAELNVSPSQVDGIVFVSQTPDYILPATSVGLQHRLGLGTGTPAFDLAYGCSGYIYGLFQAALLINSGACGQVLVCAGDTITQFVNPNDWSVRMVFGDGASATLVTRGEGTASFTLRSDGSGAGHLIVPAGAGRRPRSPATSVESPDEYGNVRSAENLYMNGVEMMNFALREVPPVIDETLELAGWTRDSVGLYALHQANQFIVNYLAKKMSLPRGTAPVAMRNTGNTGPASIPLLLGSVRDGFPPERRVRSVLCGFGVGLSWGACAVDLSRTVILAPVETAADAPAALPVASEASQVPRRAEPRVVEKSPIDPLLGRQLSLASAEKVFETRLGPDAPAMLDDHRVFEQVVYPATGFLAMACAAGRQALGSDDLSVRDLMIGQALVLPKGGVRAQTVLSPDPAGYTFRVSRRGEAANGGEADGAWLEHASGKIAAETPVPTRPPVDVHAAQSESGDELSVAAAYEQFREKRGLAYGPGFRGIERLWRRPGQGLGRVRVPEALVADAAQYVFHPVLLDGALQVLMTAFPDVATQAPYLPVGLERLRIHRQPGTTGWARARVRPWNGDDLEVLTGDVQVLDDAGEAVIDAIGFSFKRAGAASLTSARQAPGRPHRRDTPRPRGPSNIAERLRHAGDAERPRLLSDYVRQLVADVLKLRAEEVEDTTALNRMGLDSLMALELRSQLDTDLSVEVPMVKFFQNLTVAGTVTLLEAELAKNDAWEDSIISGEL